MRLLKFYADWCAPCRVLGKKLEGFDACELVSVDVDSDEGESLTEKYSIKNLPTMVLIDEEGNELKRWSGLVDVNKVKEEIKQFV